MVRSLGGDDPFELFEYFLDVENSLWIFRKKDEYWLCPLEYHKTNHTDFEPMTKLILATGNRSGGGALAGALAAGGVLRPTPGGTPTVVSGKITPLSADGTMGPATAGFPGGVDKIETVVEFNSVVDSINWDNMNARTAMNFMKEFKGLTN